MAISQPSFTATSEKRKFRKRLGQGGDAAGRKDAAFLRLSQGRQRRRSQRRLSARWASSRALNPASYRLSPCCPDDPRRRLPTQQPSNNKKGDEEDGSGARLEPAFWRNSNRAVGPARGGVVRRPHFPGKTRCRTNWAAHITLRVRKRACLRVSGCSVVVGTEGMRSNWPASTPRTSGGRGGAKEDAGSLGTRRVQVVDPNLAAAGLPLSGRRRFAARRSRKGCLLPRKYPPCSLHGGGGGLRKGLCGSSARQSLVGMPGRRARPPAAPPIAAALHRRATAPATEKPRKRRGHGEPGELRGMARAPSHCRVARVDLGARRVRCVSFKRLR